MFGNDDIGIDLGASSVYFLVKGKGIVLNERTVVAVERTTQNIIAVGDEAAGMIGRTPANILAVRPIAGGMVSDYVLLEKMMRFFMRKVSGKRTLLRPRVVISVPSTIKDSEKRQIVDVMLDAGAKRVNIVDAPMATAIGAGLNIEAHYGSMLVRIGAGCTDIAVLSLGRVIVQSTLPLAGERFDEAISRYIRRRHNLMIGERTAEELKINIGAAMHRGDAVDMDVSGRNLITGLPKTISISSDEMVEALDELIAELIENVHAVLERTPPELASDIFERGITLAGGGAQLYGLDRLMEQTLKVPCRVADDPAACTIRGIGSILDNMATLGRKLFVTTSSRRYGD